MVLKLVLDTNPIIASLINDWSVIRDILLSDAIEFYVPAFAIEEIEKHKAVILQKSGLTENEFYFTLYYLLRRVVVVESAQIQPHLAPAESLMKTVDPNDAVFVAVANSVPNDGIFSEDRHFDQAGLKRWSVNDVLQYLERETATKK